MPELPEVETIRRQLAPLVEGRRLEQVEIVDPRWSRPLAPAELEDALRGRRIESLGRRGKYLLWNLEGDVHLAQHLRMTGAVLADPDPEPSHARVRIELGPRSARERPVRLVIADPRRFGTGELLLGSEALEEFLDARLGLEPFDEGFTTEHLREALRGRRAPIKALLLDQRRIAGVGNIYADEALFRAGIHPLRAAGTLTRTQVERLRDGDPRRAAGRDRRARGEHRRLPPRRRGAGLLPGPLPGAPARGRAVPGVRRDDPQDRRRRAGDLRLRALSAAAARQAARSSSRRPSSSAASSSLKPPTRWSPTTTWGKLIIPVR